MQKDENKEPSAPVVNPMEAMLQQIKARGARAQDQSAPSEAKDKGSLSTEETITAQISELEAKARTLENQQHRELRGQIRKLTELESNFNSAKEFLLTADDHITSLESVVSAQENTIKQQKQQLAHLQEVAQLYQELEQASQVKPLPEVVVPTEPEKSESDKMEVQSEEAKMPGNIPVPPKMPPPMPPPMPNSNIPDPPKMPPPTVSSGGGLTNALKGLGEAKLRKVEKAEKIENPEPKVPPKTAPTNMADIIAGSKQFQAVKRQQEQEAKREMLEEQRKQQEQAQREAAILADRQAKAALIIADAKANFSPSEDFLKQQQERQARVAALQQPGVNQQEQSSAIEQLKQRILAAQLEQERSFRERLEARDNPPVVSRVEENESKAQEEEQELDQLIDATQTGFDSSQIEQMITDLPPLDLGSTVATDPEQQETQEMELEESFDPEKFNAELDDLMQDFDKVSPKITSPEEKQETEAEDEADIDMDAIDREMREAFSEALGNDAAKNAPLKDQPQTTWKKATPSELKNSTPIEEAKQQQPPELSQQSLAQVQTITIKADMDGLSERKQREMRAIEKVLNGEEITPRDFLREAKANETAGSLFGRARQKASNHSVLSDARVLEGLTQLIEITKAYPLSGPDGLKNANIVYGAILDLQKNNAKFEDPKSKAGSLLEDMKTVIVASVGTVGKGISKNEAVKEFEAVRPDEAKLNSNNKLK